MTSTEIAYDRTSGEYAMYVDGALVGFAANYRDASIALDQMSAEPPPDDAPGTDCPDHGPSNGDDCDKCRSCKGAHHTWQCPEVHALLFAEEKAAAKRIISKVLHRLNNPRPCPGCGDITAGDCCAACQESEGAIIRQGLLLEMDYTPAPWAA
jgi:hypothetical protein